MTAAFLVCDERQNRVTGATYRHPWALVYNHERALTMARGNSNLVYEMEEKQAQEMYDNGRITT